MDTIARDKMTKARSELVLDHPFFASLALRLEFREDPNCRSAWSNGKVLAYNPSYINAMPLEKVKGVQCHEVMHLACLHHTRRSGRDKTLWNKACDYAINPLLVEAGVSLPTGFLDDPVYTGKSADAIYGDLVNKHEETKGGGEHGLEQDTRDSREAEGQEQGGGGQDQDQFSSTGQPSGEDPEESMGATGASDRDGTTPEDQGDDPGMSGEVRDAESGGQGDGQGSAQRREEESWKAALAQAVNASRESGDLTGSLERLVSEMLGSRLDWRDLLRRFVEDSARNDFSWVRPNRRHIHSGLYLPGLENQELGEIAVAVDVSGSIGQAELSGFASELSAVLEEFDTELTVFTCDAKVTSQERLARWDLPLDFTAKGGGGTSFRPPFESLEQQGATPACLIYFTDLNSLGYPDEPAYPVLWVTPNQDHVTPPFGEVLVMELQYEH
ncbi:MAG: hypothetical protein D6E12_15625 [Desulfovibrio sp.]|nr:MAG: hypothetical protein D6E12_15625 [Desulfovibrio sp.]